MYNCTFLKRFFRKLLACSLTPFFFATSNIIKPWVQNRYVPTTEYDILLEKRSLYKISEPLEVNVQHYYQPLYIKDLLLQQFYNFSRLLKKEEGSMIFELFMWLFIYPPGKRHDHVKTILCVVLRYLYTVNNPEVQQHQIRSF